MTPKARPERGNALITAGAGGIGFEIAKGLKSDGYQVWITGTDTTAGDVSTVSNVLMAQLVIPGCPNRSRTNSHHGASERRGSSARRRSIE